MGKTEPASEPKKPSKTIQQVSDATSGWPKARELIEFTGHHVLEAQDRALMNSLYKIAHDSGKMTTKDAEWTVPLAELRVTAHESNDRLRESFKRLKQVVVTVPYLDHEGDQCELITGLFDFFDVSKIGGGRGSVRFGLPKELQPVLANSGRWGRIKAEIVHAMSSKYAIALYELIQARINLDNCIETFPLEKFRELIGVPPGKLERGSNFLLRALNPAVLEVNALADVGVTIDVRRKGNRPTGPITHVTMAWYRKTGDEYRKALKELNQPKVGRKARITGKVEQVAEE